MRPVRRHCYCRHNQRGLWKRSITLCGSKWRESGGRAPLLETLKDMPSKALEMGVCFHSSPVLGNMGGPSFPRALERRVKFLICWENFYWGIQETCTRRLWKRATLAIGDPAGEPGKGSFTGTFWETDEGGLWKQSISTTRHARR